MFLLARNLTRLTSTKRKKQKFGREGSGRSNVALIASLSVLFILSSTMALMNNKKKTVYVGGLAEEVDEGVLRAAFVPFGDLTEVQVPVDYKTEKHRGFAFVEFESQEDAKAAIDNMNDAELFGRTLKVNLAKPLRLRENSSRPVWADDEWLQKYAGKSIVGKGDGTEGGGEGAAAAGDGGGAEGPEKRPAGDTEVRGDAEALLGETLSDFLSFP